MSGPFDYLRQDEALLRAEAEFLRELEEEEDEDDMAWWYEDLERRSQNGD